ncbi:hypothetical protein LTS18_003602 [Coniosporium uncinatum]|uniref:Uncharacterized protein n=1 Tax=Coniosporium uncinatum TaxID=93489 RepID=A0ACC3D6Q4_9PEZI|nr:hypothetical protein LTS18_003602 [Coniosporium uncinatum]
MELPPWVTELMGRAAYEFTVLQPFIPTYLHLLVSALFPIYAGAHASLTRPKTAGPPARAKSAASKRQDDRDEDYEEETVSKMEGLSAMDAVWFPIMAGCTLTGLYLLIKWLEDPAILNKILGWYFGVFGCFSVGRLIADGLETAHSLFFPARYVQGGKLWRVDFDKRKVVAYTGPKKDALIRSSPLPGIFGRVPLPRSFEKLLWTLSAVPRNKCSVKFYIHSLAALSATINLYDIFGLTLGITAELYFNLVAKPWWLTNLMGFGFAYGALQLMSPTSFSVGSMILGALFFYDIYFVFYTPFMVSVAKSLDIPIKLVFPRPEEVGAEPGAKAPYAMLGLGDIILPGIMIGLALRFDLYMFYFRKQHKITNLTHTDSGSAVSGAERDDLGEDKDVNGAETVHKAPWVPLKSSFADHFWTRAFFAPPTYIKSTDNATLESIDGSSFPKPYFTAAMVGYVMGMLCTLGVMQIFNHAQPALLYLVPGTLGAIWGTALVRGEIKHMWAYDEGDDEKEVVKKEKDGKTGEGDGKDGEDDKKKAEHAAEKKLDEAERKMDAEYGDHLVYFSVSRPGSRKSAAKASNAIDDDKKADGDVAVGMQDTEGSSTALEDSSNGVVTRGKSTAAKAKSDGHVDDGGEARVKRQRVA